MGSRSARLTCKRPVGREELGPVEVCCLIDGQEKSKCILLAGLKNTRDGIIISRQCLIKATMIEIATGRTPRGHHVKTSI